MLAILCYKELLVKTDRKSGGTEPSINHFHVLRMDNSCLPSGGRSRETWRRTVEKERKAIGYSLWVQAGLAAAGRVT